MTDICAACGKPVHTIRARGMGITLCQEWVHASRWRDRTHRAIPANHEYKTVQR